MSDTPRNKDSALVLVEQVGLLARTITVIGMTIPLLVVSAVVLMISLLVLSAVAAALAGSVVLVA